MQSFQFILDHFFDFLKLIVAWAAVTTTLTLLFCLVAQPAGAGASLGANIAALRLSGSERLVHTLPNLFGSLVIGVNWIQYVLLDRKPRNPFHLSVEMGSYFARSLQVGLIAAIAALPGIVIGVAAGSLIGGRAAAVVVVSMVILGVISAVAVYGRLCIAIPSAAVSDELKVQQAFELTKGRTTTIAIGIFLSYLLPFIVLLLMMVMLGMFRAMGFKDTIQIAQEIIIDLWVYAVVGLLAGYMANAYSAFAPGDTGDKIAKTFA